MRICVSFVVLSQNTLVCVLPVNRRYSPEPCSTRSQYATHPTRLLQTTTTRIRCPKLPWAGYIYVKYSTPCCSPSLAAPLCVLLRSPRLVCRWQFESLPTRTITRLRHRPLLLELPSSPSLPPELPSSTSLRFLLSSPYLSPSFFSLLSLSFSFFSSSSLFF